MKYILASASPRRIELMKLLTDKFEVCPAGIDETVPDNIENCNRPEYLARLKALYIADKNPNALVIGADTSVLISDKILGKPGNCDDARAMLTLLSGKIHRVITGCAVCCHGRTISFSVETEVEFFELSVKDIDDYILTGEPFDKAGAYGIQGFGSLLVKRISGDYFNVVGFPVAMLSRKIKNLV